MIKEKDYELQMAMMKADIKTFGWSMPQLRMQALNTACDFELFSEEEGKATLSNAMIIADQIVHYYLTGEHQLPEKKR